MLEQLTIKNLALLRGTGMLPAAGFTVISGETGGGKSLVVMALRLLHGEKARAGLVRHGASTATIDGVFHLSDGERSAALRELYHEVLGAHPEDNRLVVSRILDANGRSRARIDGRPIPLRELQRFGAYLLEIHGQGANTSLMRAEIQTELLDAFAGTSEARHEFAEALLRARKLEESLGRLLGDVRERQERMEFLRYCLDEIGRVDPEPGEYEQLCAEEKLLSNLDHLRQTLGNGIRSLYESDEDDAVIDRVSALGKEIETLLESDPRLESAASLLGDASHLLLEATHELRSGLGRLDLDPARHEEVQERLSVLNRLLERFGPGEAELLTKKGHMEAELLDLDGDENRPDLIHAELEVSVNTLETMGARLTRKRKQAAKRLGVAMVKELAELGMEKVAIDVRITEHAGTTLLERATSLGTSEAEVWLAPNPGEPMCPLRATASGGEVARIMLVLKKILADADMVPVLVFDEADAEIGGRLGLAVGRKLKEVARKHQVVCVTHLPQIAAFSDKHFVVEKRTEDNGDTGERTIAELQELHGSEQQRELASMNRGNDAVDASALAEAKRLLDLAENQAVQ